MSKTYDRVPQKVLGQCESVKENHHMRLVVAGAAIDFIFAHAATDEHGYPTGPAVTAQGYPAKAQCRILGIKDRAMGRGDAEIILDGDKWNDWDEDAQNAIIDHELTHIAVVTNKAGIVQTDDIGRPKLRLRKHDYQVGWFVEVARRHGKSSIEVQQACQIKEESPVLFQAELELEPA